MIRFQKFGSELPYKVYAALLTQAGTDGPGPNVLQVTLDGVFGWSRTDAGLYLLDCNLPVFTVGKTAIITIADPSKSTLHFTSYDLSNATDSSIIIQTYNALGVLADDQMDHDFLEIRVYP